MLLAPSLLSSSTYDLSSKPRTEAVSLEARLIERGVIKTGTFL